jgi:hypothetical protein
MHFDARDVAFDRVAQAEESRPIPALVTPFALMLRKSTNEKTTNDLRRMTVFGYRDAINRCP